MPPRRLGGGLHRRRGRRRRSPAGGRASARSTAASGGRRPRRAGGPASGWWRPSRPGARPAATATCSGSARQVGGRARPGRRAASALRRGRPLTASTAPAHGGRSGGGGGPSSSGGGSGASRSRSMNSSDIRMPPLPSVIVWCIFCTIAARPSGRPSITVNSQSGRDRSNGVAGELDGQGPGVGVGGPRRAGGPSGGGRRGRSRGPPPRPGCRGRSRRPPGGAGGARPGWPATGGVRSRSGSGRRSKNVRLANVDDRTGSASRLHMRASTSLMRSVEPCSAGSGSPEVSARRVLIVPAHRGRCDGQTRSATLANTMPMAAPAITSEAWCTCTWTRLVATTAARP